MRTAVRLLFGSLAMLVVCLPACGGDSAPRFRSGQYEQLLLAVDSKGGVMGYYREAQGEGVVKTCSFYLSGKGAGGEIPVMTWSNQVFPGTLKARDNGVRLTIQKGLDHAGCSLVLLPQIAEGLDLDRVAEATWSELRRVSIPRTHFYAAPDEARKLKSFVVAGDIVGVVAQKDAWLEVEYHSETVTTKGWIPASSTAKLVAPER